MSFLFCALLFSVSAQPAADLVVLGGKVATMDARQSEAQAVASRGDRIVFVGRADDARKLVGARTRVIDVRGKLVIPGFIEGHGHFVSLGESKQSLDLTVAKNWDDIIAQVKRAADKTAPGKWIVGAGWHQEKWHPRPEPNVEGYPTHAPLSRVSPNHPVLLKHRTGHMVFANAKAMELAGIDARAKSPPGGEILRDAAGKPCGVFRETAMQPIYTAYNRALSARTAAERSADLREAIRLAANECLIHGVTSFQDAGTPCDVVDTFRTLAEKGELPVRLWVMLNDDNDTLARRLARYRMIGGGNHYLTVRGIKRLIDGALGTHGAWLLAPYDDLPGSIGHNTTPIASIRRTAELALEHDYQLCVHAIGDRANREVLDLYHELGRRHVDLPKRRWRIEHVQHLHPDDIPRFASLGVIASMQACHATSDGPFVVRRLGIRRAKDGAYAWQSLLRAGARVTNGTDVPVEPISPVDCFYASVTRKLTDGTLFFPEQAMTREQALRSYTIDAAYAAFQEDQKGSLSVGKLADMVVLDRDILTVPEDRIQGTKVLYTIVGGKVKHEQQSDEQGLRSRTR
jgi:predicted amidohydrolase YtcJ